MKIRCKLKDKSEKGYIVDFIPWNMFGKSNFFIEGKLTPFAMIILDSGEIIHRAPSDILVIDPEFGCSE